jgi:hypothetical protein
VRDNFQKETDQRYWLASGQSALMMNSAKYEWGNPYTKIKAS